MKILGIETSCDETAAAIVEDGKKLLTNVVASSAEIHQKYGGIVPEVAARKQVESIIPVLTEAMTGFTKDDIDAIAVTVGPGLIGSLLVGVETAKTLAFAWEKPIIPVNHVLAHIYAVFLETKGDYSSSERAQASESRSNIKESSRLVRLSRTRSNNKKVEFPAIALVVSGGHTELYLMKSPTQLKWLGGTLDDAAGECFDKCARLLGLPYPGGPQIAKAAEQYQRHYPSSERSESRSFHKYSKDSSRLRSNDISLPRPMIDDESLNFSFSGLKTAVLREYKKLFTNSQPTTHYQQLISVFAYEIQEAITDVLVDKTLRAAHENKASSIIVSGGVAANKRLSQKFTLLLQNVHPTTNPSTHFARSGLRNLQPTTDNIQLFIPPPPLCVDSASYIAAYAYYHNKPVDWKSIEARPDLSVEVGKM